MCLTYSCMYTEYEWSCVKVRINFFQFSQKISYSSRKNTENVSVNQSLYEFCLRRTFLTYGNIAVIIAKYFLQKLFQNIEANTYAWIDRNLQT